jgi:hypothetical protein
MSVWVPPQEAVGTHLNRVRPFDFGAPYRTPTLAGCGKGGIRTIGSAIVVMLRTW